MPPPPPDLAQQLQLYLETMRDLCRNLPLGPLDPGGRESARVTLEQVYVELDAQPVLAVNFERQKAEARSALAYVAAYPRLVILGDPGSGKSTFLRFLALRLAQARLEPDGEWLAQLGWPVYSLGRGDPYSGVGEAGRRGEAEEPLGRMPWPHPPLVPVLVTLRDFAATPFDPASPLALWEFVAADLARRGLAETTEAVHAALARGEGVLLLDGVDEVPPARRAQVWQAVGALAGGVFNRCRWLATCRSLSFVEEEAAAARARGRLTLAALNPAQIETFIATWYRALTELGEKTPTQGDALAALLANGELTPPERAEAGQTLARLGDFRPGVNLNPPRPLGEGLGVRAGGEGLILPDILWCNVESGEFIMGSDDGPTEEKPAHRVFLPAFQISQFPITNVQFGAFVAAGGYRQERYWPEAKKEGYRQAGWFKGLLDSEARDRPYDFGSPFNLPNHPVVGVSWYEAVAFCRWLSEQLGQVVRLPSEAEWEKAARGTDGRKYPWGNKEETAARCNMRDTGLNTTSAVGMFPSGANPDYGVMDMSGNVWEWCSTIWAEKAYPFKVQDEWVRDYLNRTDVHLVLRGGAFVNGAGYVRCAARNWFQAYDGYGSFGFRVVLPHNF